MKSILHINSYFTTNKLHGELVQKMDSKEWRQTVFIPIGNKDEINTNRISGLQNTFYYYKVAFNKITRLIWPLKMLFIWLSLKSVVKKNKYDVVHAHSLIVNGLIAYLYYRKTNTPYVVTVRNTDINIFLKRSRLFKYLGLIILKNSHGVIFLSPAYRDIQLKSNISKSVFDEIFPKTVIIPNGVNDFWIKNIARQPKKLSKETVKIVFSGKLRKNKNVDGLLDACSLLYKEGVNISLDIIGDGPLLNTLKNEKKPFLVKFHGYINDRERLRQLYNSCHIMVVPSFRESFGLVYVEGMSQGLPAIYTKGQGFDGYYEDGYIGYSVNSDSSRSIADKIALIINSYTTISSNALNEVGKFSWHANMLKLMEVYEKAILT